ncbi:hypothetical protein ACS15_4965 [Ralstonia insidiosa]|uniref:Uncharacterized protein n=1 Tax=Ralstonia insidiosa TaxID=190721 RepID=A0AAC9BJS5_9RALS|nr:hypothetical protein ACS15_4965 [Ralstonia insidiosa]
MLSEGVPQLCGTNRTPLPDWRGRGGSLGSITTDYHSNRLQR